MGELAAEETLTAMIVLPLILTVLISLVALVWLSRHWLIHSEKLNGFVLTDQFGDARGDLPPISVVVAAKDEGENIETCLRTMLQQDYGEFEIVACNDRSEDDTAAIIERVAADDGRVRLINIKHLPDGWCGKCNAMRHGIAAARHDWICMIDADCKQTSPRTLSTAIQYALTTKADLLSVLPVLDTKTFWEDVVQPVCGGVMMIWFNPEKVNNANKPNAYANGAFMLMKRSAYDAIGGHEAVKDRVNEDMHMAALTKGAGLNLRVVRNRGLYSVRMYTSLRGIIRGWSRIFFGTFGTLRRLVLSLAVLLVMSLLPYAMTILGFAMAAADVEPVNWWLACGAAGAVTICLQLGVICRFYRLIGAKWHMAWSYPLGGLITVMSLILALSKLRPGAKVVWKNTSYTSAAKGI